MTRREADNPTPARTPPHAVAASMTPGGRGAIATIRVENADEALQRDWHFLFRAANGRPLSEQPPRRVLFGQWGSEPAEDVVVCRIGRTTIEIHCHGGKAAARRILADLERGGCTVVSWSALVSTRQTTLEAECIESLAQARTIRTAEILLRQQAGLLRAAFERLLPEGRGSIGENRPLEGTSGEFQQRHQLESERPWSAGPRGAETRRRLREEIEALLGWAEFGLHLTQPWKVVLAGRPNVGKSSLINALVGFSRSIVYEVPGTTRDVVTAESALEGWPVEFADTAGIRDDAAEVEREGIARARARFSQADCRVLLVDVSQPLEEADRVLLSERGDAVLVAHKCDLPEAIGACLPPQAYRVSSLTREGLEGLIRAIVEQLVPEIPKSGTPIPFTARQVELLRAAHSAVETGDAARYDDAIRRLLR